jgi:integrase
VNGVSVRKSLETLNWEAAGRIIREWEETGIERGARSVSDACDRFYAYAEANGLKQPTLDKYKLLFDEMKTEFAQPLETVSVDDLSKYREGWDCGQVTARGKIGRLRAFYKFCMERGWVKSNPAAALKLPKETFRQKIPYSRAELEKITWGVEMYPNQGKYGERQKHRLRAFLLVLRYTALRIRDVCLLRPSHIEDGKIMLYQSKTGLPVWVPVPVEVNDAVAKMGEAGEFLFWSGSGNIKSCVGDWQRSLKVLSRISGVHIFAHRYRTNLAIELLGKGVSLDKVATILGNTPAVVSKHYLPFVKERQDSIEEAVKKSWS